MTALLRDKITLIWTGLVLATLLSWWLGTDHGTSNHQVATVGVMLVAFAKVRFVGMHFMDLRDAPIPLRLIFDAYVLIVGTAIIGTYLFF
jgi:hypothetical protein